MGVEMPFPLSNPNACVDSGLACPLEKEKNYEYAQTLPVLKSYPKVISETFQFNFDKKKFKSKYHFEGDCNS